MVFADNQVLIHSRQLQGVPEKMQPKFNSLLL